MIAALQRNCRKFVVKADYLRQDKDSIAKAAKLYKDKDCSAMWRMYTQDRWQLQLFASAVSLHVVQDTLQKQSACKSCETCCLNEVFVCIVALKQHLGHV